MKPSLFRILPLLLAVCAHADLQISQFSLSEYPHAQVYSESRSESMEYELGLGALQKIGGRWRHKASEHLQAELARQTWQVLSPYTAEDAYDWYQRQLVSEATLLYQCQGRGCGSSAQWADRVFSERVLYGHDERQRYSVWRIVSPAADLTLVLYAVDRANRRHYVHIDMLRHEHRADD